MARKFVVGVELLTGLVIGAAAAAAAVSFIIVFLVNTDAGAERGQRATATAYTLGIVYNSNDEEFEDHVYPLLQSGNLDAVVVLDEDGELLSESGIASYEIPIPGETNGWYFSEVPFSGIAVGVLPSKSSLQFVYRSLLVGLAALTLALSILAILTPRYLARSVITPLREILVEADRFTSGGGSSAEAAGASFHRLVELLHQRDQQLNELREAAERRADVVEERSAAILSVLGSAVLALDNNGLLTLFNRQSDELFRLTGDDIGNPFPWDRTAAGEALRSVLENRDAGGNTSSEFQVQESSQLQSRMFGVSLSTSGKDETAVLVTDVTRISELERSIADQAAMADIGAASAGISHEMGNTLCALAGFVDLLAKGHTDKRTQNILSEFRHEVSSARQLISSFATFARWPQPQKSILCRDDISDLCREACGNEVDFSISITEDDFQVSADSKLLSACVRNILRNAAEASDNPEISLNVFIDEHYLSIVVLDNGPGLSLDSTEIFRPFRTTKNISGGNMGLGLPVSRRIIRAMGGELTGRNRPEKGAVFTITLPLIDSEGAAI